MDLMTKKNIVKTSFFKRLFDLNINIDCVVFILQTFKVVRVKTYWIKVSLFQKVKLNQ